jgi:hypothetical protein
MSFVPSEDEAYAANEARRGELVSSVQVVPPSPLVHIFPVLLPAYIRMPFGVQDILQLFDKKPLAPVLRVHVVNTSDQFVPESILLQIPFVVQE